MVAEAFVAMPFLVLTLEAAFRSADPRLEEAARTLGASRLTVFRRVTVPSVAPSLAAGTVLCWARALGETEQRIYALPAWRDTPFYTDAERAVLAFTEAVTTLEHQEIPDELFDELRGHFDEETIGKILIAIVVINSWNRLMIAQRAPVGDYVSRHLR